MDSLKSNTDSHTHTHTHYETKENSPARGMRRRLTYERRYERRAGFLPLGRAGPHQRSDLPCSWGLRNETTALGNSTVVRNCLPSSEDKQSRLRVGRTEPSVLPARPRRSGEFSFTEIPLLLDYRPVNDRRSERRKANK